MTSISIKLTENKDDINKDMKESLTRSRYDKHDLYYMFHDVVLDAIGKDLDKDILLKIYETLPESIRCTAEQWGLSDTVFRDEAYEWIENNVHEIAKYIQ